MSKRTFQPPFPFDHRDETLDSLIEEDRRKWIETGASLPFFRCVYLYGAAERPLPPWIVDELSGAIHTIINDAEGQRGESDLNKVFGPAFPKGSHRSKRGLRRKWAIVRVGLLIEEASDRGDAIDDELFSRIGRETGYGGKSKIKELWREYRSERRKPG